MTTLDLSQYDLSTFDAPGFKAAGVTGAIFGVYAPAGPGPMQSAAKAAQIAGLTVHGFYGLPYFGSPAGETRDIQWAINNALQLGVLRVWIDCEIDASAVGFADDHGATPLTRVQCIRKLVKMIEDAGLEPGIYTAPWWWRPNTGDTHEFSHLPLWFANYGANDGTLPPYTTLPDPFGGWTVPAVHQYTSQLFVCGRNRDANYLLEEEGLTDNDILAIFGSTEADPAERLANAKYRYEQSIKTGHSPFDTAANAEANLKTHTTNHGGGTTMIPTGTKAKVTFD